ncbi:MAG: DsrE family protein [Nitrospirae bacterium]|nr:DsrE family protein [Nitrospirota bacterium]
MAELCILVRTAPYSKINAAEAVRHINGAVNNNVKTSVVFVDDGVYCLKDNQDMGVSGFTSISAAVKQIIGTAKMLEDEGDTLKIYTHKGSLKECGIGADKMLSGFELVDDKGLAKVVGSAKTLMIF